MAVWIPEFVDYFNSTLPQIQVDGKPVTVLYSKPDISVRFNPSANSADMEGMLPEINFKMYDQLDDKKRYESDILLKETINNTLYTKPVSIPYNLYFQFILAAKYQDDIVQMETQFTKLFPPRGYIHVLDPSLNPPDYYDLDFYFLQYKVADTDSLATPRYGQVPDRLFRRVYRYMLRCEQDIFTYSSASQVSSVSPSTTTM